MLKCNSKQGLRVLIRPAWSSFTAKTSLPVFDESCKGYDTKANGHTISLAKNKIPTLDGPQVTVAAVTQPWTKSCLSGRPPARVLARLPSTAHCTQSNFKRPMQYCCLCPLRMYACYVHVAAAGAAPAPAPEIACSSANRPLHARTPSEAMDACRAATHPPNTQQHSKYLENTPGSRNSIHSTAQVWQLRCCCDSCL